VFGQITVTRSTVVPHDIRWGEHLIADVYETLRANEAVWANIARRVGECRPSVIVTSSGSQLRSSSTLMPRYPYPRLLYFSRISLFAGIPALHPDTR
jgi:hypothetical protein